LATLGDYTVMTRLIKNNDWNSVHVIAQAGRLSHMLNGNVVSILIDDDPASRAMEGLLGVQVHTGPPMKVEYRNIRLKRVNPTAAPVMVSRALREQHVDQVVRVVGIVTNTTVPTIAGVDVALSDRDLRGQTAEAIGILRRWEVTAAQLNAARAAGRLDDHRHWQRGAGVFYRLQEPDSSDRDATASVAEYARDTLRQLSPATRPRD
jgi:hypothetical protein